VIPLLLAALAVLDAMFAGFRAACGREGHIFKRGYYRRALALGAGAGAALVAGLALLTLVAQPVLALDELDSPNAIAEAKSLQHYLASIQGKAILSGQQEIAWDNKRTEEDTNYILQTTGKLPVVRGFDFLQYVKSPSTRASETA
jgi:hypothetical protein